jgi:hypothetical protein
MGRVAEVADIVTWLLTEPGADDRRLDRIAAILAHSDTTRHAGVRAALDATQSAMADPAFDDARSGRLCARLERLTADSPPTASDVAALRLLLDPTGGPERPPDLSAAATAPPPAAAVPAQPPPPAAVVPVQPPAPAAETYLPPAEEDHAQWLAGLAGAPPAVPVSAAGDAGWPQPHADTTPTVDPATRHAPRSPEPPDGAPMPQVAGTPWPEGPAETTPWSGFRTGTSPVPGVGAGAGPESPADVGAWSLPVAGASPMPPAADAAWPDSPTDLPPPPAGPVDARPTTGFPGTPKSHRAADVADPAEAQQANGWPANQSAATATPAAATATPAADARSRWAPAAPGTPTTPHADEYTWPESPFGGAPSVPAVGADHTRWAPDAAGPPPMPPAGNARWPENHHDAAPTPTTRTPATDPGDTPSPAAPKPFLPRDGLSRWPVNPTAPVPASPHGPDTVNSRWPEDLAGRVATPGRHSAGTPAWPDHLAAAFPPPDVEGAIAQGPPGEDPVEGDRPPGSAEREPWVR